MRLFIAIQFSPALRESLLAGCAALREVIVVPTGGVSTVYANDGGVVLAV